MSKKIFVVEDDAAYAAELKAAFEGAGLAPALFETANDALKAAEAELPALVVTGAMLEDLGSGFRLSDWFKANAANVPVVMVTGIDELTGLDFASRVAKGELYATAYIKKPASADAVMEQAKALL